MAILDEKITARLLDQLEGNSSQEKWNNCRNEYPWYPLPWLMTAHTDTDKQKAALWFKNEHRIHWLLNYDDRSKDVWSSEQKKSIETEETAVISTPEIEEFAEEIVENSADKSNQYPGEIIDTQKVEIIQNAHIEQLPEPANEIEELVAESSILPIETLQVEPTEQPLVEIQQDSENVVLNAEEAALKRDMETGVSEALENDIFPSGDIETSTEDLPASNEEAATATVSTPNETVAENEPGQQEKEKIEIPPIKESKEEDLVFEPLYTTDYFASQGIRVDPRAVPQTKFDRQVRSFTQWLKTMKRIAPETPAAADPLVDAQASESVAEKEVITEAMAEVLEKQGKYQKAIEILGKLILLHPEKSAFFAAQIENLKAKQ